MKKRFSVEKAQWSDEREKSYFDMCMQIAYTRKEQLKVINNNVYLIANDKESLFCEPTKEKTTWYET